MTSMKPMFEVITKDGHAYRVWADGSTEGFPPDSIIINRTLASQVRIRLPNDYALNPNVGEFRTVDDDDPTSSAKGLIDHITATKAGLL